MKNIEGFLDKVSIGNTIRNYIIPGMDSMLINNVRMFHNTKKQEIYINPHSHRFDLLCQVIDGSVINTIFKPSGYLDASDEYGFMASQLTYLGSPGKYIKTPLSKPKSYVEVPTKYVAGDWYWMGHEEIHTIHFSEGAKVLLFESDARSETSIVLEPFDHNGVKPFKVEDWMFQST